MLRFCAIHCKSLTMRFCLAGLLHRAKGFIFSRGINSMAEAATNSSKLPEDFKEIKEGKARILFENTNNVFYNNVQEFNRDLTIVAITEFAKEQLSKEGIEAVEFQKDDETVGPLTGANVDTFTKRVYPGEKCEEGIKVLEALSASGLRSVRLAKEVPGIKEIVANDISKSAVEAIRRNVEFNHVGNIVSPNEDDANIVMYQHKKTRELFDVIDIDPYGSAAQFLDAAVQAVKPQGLLCVTCTDMAVLAGRNAPENCWSQYRAMPLKTEACHEQALRILLGSIEQHANRSSRYIEPLLCISVDFYIRVFVKVHFGKSKVKMSASKQAYVFQCGGCSSFYTQPVGELKNIKKGHQHIPGVGPPVGSKCELCGHRHSIGGPIWAAPMYNMDFLQKVLKSVTNFPERLTTSNRIKGFVTMMTEELQDVPLHYVTNKLSSIIRSSCLQEIKLKSALLNAGYRVSSFHGKTSSIKTDAPPNVVWDIMKAWWVLQNLSKDKLIEGTPAHALVHRESTTENINFTPRPDAEAESKKRGIVRFPILPENWGPKSRARDNISDDEKVSVNYLQERSKKFQGKRKVNLHDSSEKKAKTEGDMHTEAKESL